MNFFLQTLSNIFQAFILIIKGDTKASLYVHTSDAHWLLSWLMFFAASLIYLLYLPAAFISEINQELLPKDTSYFAFKNANLFSLVFVQISAYAVAYLLGSLLIFSGDIRRYIIAQNWTLLATILLLLPLSTVFFSENNPLASLMIFIFFFILFFAYRSIKIFLGLNGPKAFLLLLVLLVFELSMERVIDSWFGLIPNPG